MIIPLIIFFLLLTISFTERHFGYLYHRDWLNSRMEWITSSTKLALCQHNIQTFEELIGSRWSVVGDAYILGTNGRDFPCNSSPKYDCLWNAAGSLRTPHVVANGSCIRIRCYRTVLKTSDCCCYGLMMASSLTDIWTFARCSIPKLISSSSTITVFVTANLGVTDNDY